MLMVLPSNTTPPVPGLGPEPDRAACAPTWRSGAEFARCTAARKPPGHTPKAVTYHIPTVITIAVRCRSHRPSSFIIILLLLFLD